MDEKRPPFDDDWWREAEKRAEAEFHRLYRRAQRAVRGPDDHQTGSRAHRRARRWPRRVAALVIFTVLILAGGYYLGEAPSSHPVSASGGSGHRPGPSVEPATSTAPRVDLPDAFHGTPAEHFPRGAAGVVLPPAHAVGDLSADTVAHDLGVTKRLLVLSRLDPQMVDHRDPRAFLAVLAPDARSYGARIFSTSDGSALVIATRLAPGSTLLPTAVRVTGSITYDERVAGQLTVHTRFAFVYPLRPPGPDLVGGQQDLLAVVRADVDFLFVHGDRYRAGDRGVFLGSSRGFEYNVDCSEAAAGLLAPPGADESVLPLPEHRDIRDYYEPTRPMPTKGNCPSH